MLMLKIQGTQALIHYIERSTAQLVKYKALNLVDVGSSPMVEITLYTVIINDHIYKVPAHYCIMTRPLGATLVEVFMSIRKLQVPGCCKHDNPALGGYIVWSIQFLLVTGMNNMDFFESGSIYIGASLKSSLCFCSRLGVNLVYSKLRI